MLNLVKISDIFNIEKGSLQSSKNIPGEYDFVTASTEWKTHNDFSHDCEALIFAMAASGSLGRTHYVNGKFITSDLCFILTPKSGLESKIDLRFYYYYINSVRPKLVKETATGTSKLSINQTNFSNYEVIFGDIKDQEKLRKVYEDVDTYSSELLVKIYKQERYVSRLRQTILQMAVEGKLVSQDENDEPASIILEKIRAEKQQLIKDGKLKKEKEFSPITDEEKPFTLPKGWEWCKFNEVATIASNLVDPKQYHNYLHIAPDNIEKSTFKLLPCRTVAEDDVKSSNHLFFKGQIVYSKIRPALRKAVLAPFDGLCSADMYPLDVYIEAKYLLLYLVTDTFTEQVLKSDNRVKMPKTNQNELLKIVVPVSPLAEQQRIVKKVDILMSLCDQLEKNIIASKEASALLMQAVLSNALVMKNKNIIDFPALSNDNDYIEDWDIAAKADVDIKPETQAKIAARLAELSKAMK